VDWWVDEWVGGWIEVGDVQIRERDSSTENSFGPSVDLIGFIISQYLTL
jgi:hypothetical protein